MQDPICLSVGSPNRTQIFPVTDLTHAVDAARGLGLPHGTQIDIADLEIIAPELFSFDAPDSHIARTASQYLALLADDLAGATDQVISNWLSVKKTLARVQDGDLEASALVPELEAAIRFVRDEKVRKEVLGALEFYDSMPVNVVQIPSVRPAPQV